MDIVFAWLEGAVCWGRVGSLTFMVDPSVPLGFESCGYFTSSQRIKTARGTLIIASTRV